VCAISSLTSTFAISSPDEFLLANVNVRVLRFVCDRIYICDRNSVCRLSSVTLVHPTQPVEIFGNFFHHTIAQGL